MKNKTHTSSNVNYKKYGDKAHNIFMATYWKINEAKKETEWKCVFSLGLLGKLKCNTFIMNSLCAKLNISCV